MMAIVTMRLSERWPGTGSKAWAWSRH